MRKIERKKKGSSGSGSACGADHTRARCVPSAWVLIGCPRTRNVNALSSALRFSSGRLHQRRGLSLFCVHTICLGQLYPMSTGLIAHSSIIPDAILTDNYRFMVNNETAAPRAVHFLPTKSPTCLWFRWHHPKHTAQSPTDGCKFARLHSFQRYLYRLKLPFPSGQR